MSRVEDIKTFAHPPQSHVLYQLSILVGVDSLLYGLWDGHEWVALRQMQYARKKEAHHRFTSLSTWLEQEDFWGVDFSSVRIGFGTTRFTLLPKRLFSLQHKRSYLEKLLPLGPTDILQAEVIEWLGLVLVYALDNAWLRLLSARFPTAAFSHCGSAALRFWRGHLRENTHLHLCIMDQMLYLWALEYEHLLFFNAFRWETPVDVLYYTSLVFQQTGMKREKTPVLISGMIEKDAKIIQKLKPYFPLIQMEDSEYKTFLLRVL